MFLYFLSFNPFFTINTIKNYCMIYDYTSNYLFLFIKNIQLMNSYNL